MKHDEMVKALFKDPSVILKELTPFKINVVHSAVGLSGESGELLDMAKKYVFNNIPLDMDKVIKELGDIEFYLEAFRQALQIDREVVITENIRKLSKRYEGFQYSDKAALQRVDLENGSSITFSPGKTEDGYIDSSVFVGTPSNFVKDSWDSEGVSETYPGELKE